MTRGRWVGGLVAGALVLTACSSSGAGATASPTLMPKDHACALVRYWADDSGTVADPDTGFTTQPEIIALAKAGWPDTATEAKFVQLYDDLTANLSNKAYAAEATAFLTSAC